jgi:secretion/DNA translocation related TadE-like protein
VTWRRARQGAGSPTPDSGGATVLVVAMAGVLMFVTLGLAAVGGLVTAQRRAQSAADLTALAAAASIELDACAEALRTAAANAAALDSCELDGSDVLVTVSVAGPSVPGRDPRVSAQARAGPG